MSDLRLVLRSLSARPTSTSITILLIAIAVALLLTMRSLRDAGRQSFTRGVGNAHLIVSAESSPLVTVLNGLFYANPPRAPITDAKAREIVEGFPWAMAVPTQLGDSFLGHPVVATTPEFLERFEPAPGGRGGSQGARSRTVGRGAREPGRRGTDWESGTASI